MRATLLVAGLCWLIPAVALPQARSTPRIQGVVTDSLTGSAVPQAVVMLEGYGEAWTDRRGRFVLERVPDGTYLMAAVTRDCRIAAVRLQLEGGEPVRVDLTVGLQRMDGSNAVRTRERAEATAVKVTTHEEIMQLGQRSLSEILRRIAPSMVGPPASRPGSSVRLRERGVSTVTGNRTPLLLLDGVRVSDMQALDGIDPASVARIEVAAGVVGGWQQGMDGASGVIHIYTRNAKPVENPWCGAAPRR